jgi:hypothetical protein
MREEELRPIFFGILGETQIPGIIFIIQLKFEIGVSGGRNRGWWNG